MLKGFVAIILILVFLVPVSADVSPATWNWNTYQGTVTWQVTAVEDQGGCQGPVLTNTYTVPIQFRGNSAVMGDVGHGSAGGTFTSGNVLHIDSRSVADPPGESKLSQYDVSFTPDCSGFTAQYSWDYTGPDTAGACTGTVSLTGTNSQRCPVPGEVTLIPSVAPASDYLGSALSGARNDLNQDLNLRDLRDQEMNSIYGFRPGGPASADEIATTKGLISGQNAKINAMDQQAEKEYNDILVKDPNNFWANWDLAQLKKEQGNWNEYFADTSKALSNKNIAAGTEQEIKDNIIHTLGLPTYPTPDTDYTMYKLHNAVMNPPTVNGINAQSQVTDPSLFKVVMTGIYGKGSNLVNALIFGQSGTGGQ